MPAELPRFSFGWDDLPETSRRKFLASSIRIIGTAGTIYAAPWLLTGCEEEDKEKQEEEELKIPDRTFQPKFAGWIEEPALPEIKELGVSGFLFAKAELDGRVLIKTTGSDELHEVKFPFKPQGIMDVSFSPKGDKLAVGVYFKDENLHYPIRGHFVFLVDINDGSVREIVRLAREQELQGSLKWSPNGELLMINSFPGEEPLPPRYPAGPMGSIPFYTNVIDTKTGRVVYGVKGAVGIGFSPDSRFILTQFRQLQFNLTSVDGSEKRFPIFPMAHGAGFDWVTSGKAPQAFALLCDSTKFIAGREVCEGGRIVSINLESGEQSTIKSGETELSAFSTSPDGNYLLLTGDDKRGKITILNLADGKTLEVNTHDFDFGNRNFYARHFIFKGNSELRFSEHNSRGGFDIYSLRLPQGVVQKLGTVDPENGYVGLSSFIDPETIWYIVDNTTGRNPSIKVYTYSVTAGEKTFLAELNSFYDKFDVYPARLKVNEDSLVETEQGLFRIHGGRRYTVSPEVFSLIPTPVQQVPFRAIEKLPESVNKLDFGSGDILEARGRAWYLQNGGRYEVSASPENFARRRFKNFKTHEVPGWIADKIKINEDPPTTFRDQYGREIDARSPRLVGLMAGLGSTSDEALKIFEKVIKGLKLIGWQDNQIVFISHKVEKDTKGSLVPREYDDKDSRSPIDSRQNCRLFMDWLSLHAPLSQIVGCGHSMGGDAIFQSAVVRPDLFCTVITINAPLTGTDKNLSVSAEDLLAFGCDRNIVLADKCEAMQFYKAAGENPTYAPNIENQAGRIRNRGVDLFTFSAARDPIAVSSHAVLKSSNDRIGNYQVQLRWDWVKDYRWDPRVDLDKSVHGLLLQYDPFIAELLRVIGRP